jgi:MFS family permease
MTDGPLRYPAFRWLLAGRTINVLGGAIAPVALAFAVLDLTGSATDLGLVVGARSLMNVLLLLYGGVLADRVPRRLLMVGSATAAATTQGAVAVLLLTEAASIPLLALLSAVNGAVAGVGFPASAAVVADTVPRAVLAQTNASLRIGLNAGSVVGVSLGAGLVALVGPGWGVAVDAASFALAAICFSLIRIPLSRAEKRAGGVLIDLREGWQEFRSRTWVWVIVAQFMVVNAALAGAEGVLGPVVADETIGRGAYGVVLACSTVGLVVGSVVALRYQPQRALLFGTIVILATALPSLALAVAPSLVVLMLAFLLAGITIDQFGVAWDTALQENVPKDRLARVYSYDALGSFVAIPAGQVLVGPLAAAFGTRATLLGCSAAVLVATVLALCSGSVRNLRRVPAGSEVA